MGSGVAVVGTGRDWTAVKFVMRSPSARTVPGVMRSESRRDRDMASRDRGQVFRHDGGVSASSERRCTWGAVAGGTVRRRRRARLARVRGAPESRRRPELRRSPLPLPPRVGHRPRAPRRLLATLRPRNRLGWLFIGLAALHAGSLFLEGYGLADVWGEWSLPGRLVGAVGGGVGVVPRYWLLPVARAAALSGREGAVAGDGGRLLSSPCGGSGQHARVGVALTVRLRREDAPARRSSGPHPRGRERSRCKRSERRSAALRSCCASRRCSCGTTPRARSNDVS